MAFILLLPSTSRKSRISSPSHMCSLSCPIAFSLEIGSSSSISMYSALLIGPTPNGMAKDMTILWCIPSSYLTGMSVRLTALCRYFISSRCPMNFMGPYLANFTLTRKEFSLLFVRPVCFMSALTSCGLAAHSATSPERLRLFSGTFAHPAPVSGRSAPGALFSAIGGHNALLRPLPLPHKK